MKLRQKEEGFRRSNTLFYDDEIKRYRKTRQGVKYVNCECNQQTIADSCDKCQYYQKFKRTICDTNTDDNLFIPYRQKDRFSDIDRRYAIGTVCVAVAYALAYVVLTDLNKSEPRLSIIEAIAGGIVFFYLMFIASIMID